AGVRARGRRGPCSPRRAGGGGLDEGSRRVPRRRRARGRDARAAPRDRLPRGPGAPGARMVPQVPRARRARRGGAARVGGGRAPLETRLGVFADFRPKLPTKFRDARYLFLGNIDPELQLGVLDQVKQPALVACDTMNYWIHSKRDLLLELLRHIDILMINDS